MHRIFRVKAYEMEHGPHFNEEHARKAVMKMENEDGTRGPHWSLEETSALASQYGISLSGKFNRYDWFVALNMVYSYLCVTRLIHYRVLLLLDLIVCYLTILLNLMFLVLRLMHKHRLSMISSVNLKCVKCRTRLTLFVKKIISQLCQLLSRLRQLTLLVN